MPIFYPSFRRKGRKKGKLKVFIFIIVILFGFLLLLDAKLKPLIKSMGESNAKAIAIRAINDAVLSELEKEEVNYNDLITIDKDTNNRVTALQTNVVKMNKLKARLSVAILNKISSVEESTIKIPLGNIINGEALSGVGPRISIKVVPMGSVNSDIISSFEAAGINQTRHRILIQVKVSVGIIMPGYVTSSAVETTVPVAETVIVGEVPQRYTTVDSLSKLNGIENK